MNNNMIILERKEVRKEVTVKQRSLNVTTFFMEDGASGSADGKRSDIRKFKEL